MDSTKHSTQKSPHDPKAFTGWGLLVGAGLGLAISLWGGHWLAWTGSLTFVGWVTGAVIDRARLP